MTQKALGLRALGLQKLSGWLNALRKALVKALLPAQISERWQARLPSLVRGTAPIPDALWHATLQRHPFLHALTTDEQARLRELSAAFLSMKEFTGAGGLVVTDEIALAVTVQAVRPLLHLAPHTGTRVLQWYDDFVGIVLHPDAVVAPREFTDEHGVVHHYDEELAGEAMEGGPVMLSWRDVADAAAGAADGYNLVIHEFAHKIDLRDGQPDGCPPLPSARARRAWIDTLQHEYERFREQVLIAERFSGPQPWLDAYGASAIDEFFAVACEAYFVQPQRLQADWPALHALLAGFFDAPRAPDPSGP